MIFFEGDPEISFDDLQEKRKKLIERRRIQVRIWSLEFGVWVRLGLQTSNFKFQTLGYS